MGSLIIHPVTLKMFNQTLHCVCIVLCMSCSPCLCRESNLILTKATLNRMKSTDAMILNSKTRSSSPSLPRPVNNRTGNSDISDIHICVLCLKALMNNAVRGGSYLKGVCGHDGD